MAIRGIRGAITIETDTEIEVLSATRELLEEIVSMNPGLKPEEIASALFTATEDIISAFPARAAREIGWDHVPMICAREIPVTASLEKCIRVLIHWNTDVSQGDVQHTYLRRARSLRPDLTNNELAAQAEGERK